MLAGCIDIEPVIMALRFIAPGKKEKEIFMVSALAVSASLPVRASPPCRCLLKDCNANESM
ncbi:MAG: hypothetical protein RIB78_10590 [Gammaproteobacteria bacterium]